jgi:hypothetical protein
MKLIIEAPLNNLSFGNVSVNLLREFYKQGDDVALFEKGNSDLSAFDKLDDDFKNWINNCTQFRINKLSKDIPTLNLWHIPDSHKRISKNQFLFTFHETDSITFEEKKLVDLQDGVFLTNQESIDSLKRLGCKNVHRTNLGFDPDFKVIEVDKPDNKIHFTLFGKYEKRKHTQEIIKAWLKKYGNDNRYMLTCCITNPFLNSEDMVKIINSILDFKHYKNINFLPHLATNTEMNHALNASDIDLTGMSGAEGWNLPAFNATALGKWSIVYNHTGHKSWANSKNCILLEAPEKEECYDGVFFKRGAISSQGNIYSFYEDQAIEAMEYAIKKAGSINEEGLKLQQDFTYEKTVKDIKEIMSQSVS